MPSDVPFVAGEATSIEEQTMERVLLLHFATEASPRNVRTTFKRVVAELEDTKGLPNIELDTWSLDGTDDDNTVGDGEEKFIMSTKKHHMQFELRNPLSIWLASRKRAPAHSFVAVGFALFAAQFVDGFFQVHEERVQNTLLVLSILAMSLHLIFNVEWCILKELMKILEFWYFIGVSIVAHVSAIVTSSVSTLNTTLAIFGFVSASFTVSTLDATPRISTRWTVPVVIVLAAVVLGEILYNIFYPAINPFEYMSFLYFVRFHMHTVQQGCFGYTFALLGQWAYRLVRYDAALLRFPYSKCYVSESYKKLIAGNSAKAAGSNVRSTMVVLAAVLYEVQGKQDVLLEAVKAMTAGEDEWPGIRFIVVERLRGEIACSQPFEPQTIRQLDHYGPHIVVKGRGTIDSFTTENTSLLSSAGLSATSTTTTGGSTFNVATATTSTQDTNESVDDRCTVTLLPVIRHVMIRKGMVMNPKWREWLEARIPHLRTIVIAFTILSFTLDAALSSFFVGIRSLNYAAFICEIACMTYFLTIIQRDIVMHHLKTMDFWITVFNVCLVETLTGIREYDCHHDVAAVIFTAAKCPLMALLAGTFDAAASATEFIKGFLALALCLVNVILLSVEQWHLLHGDTNSCPYDLSLSVGAYSGLRYTSILMNVEINFAYYYGRMAHRYLHGGWEFANLQFGARRLVNTTRATPLVKEGQPHHATMVAPREDDGLIIDEDTSPSFTSERMHQ